MSATLASLLNDVYALTLRPELVAQTTLAVQHATLKMHHTDFYCKDLSELSYTFETSEYLQDLDWASTLTRYRAIQWIRKRDPDTQENMEFLTPIDPTQALDPYKITKTNVYYGSGVFLRLRTDTPWAAFTLSFYQNPDITSGSYSSWIADQHPYAIVNEAARRVFKTIGKDDEASMYESLVAEAVQEIKISNVVVNGY